MQGKACFNFKTVDDTLFKELEQIPSADTRRGRRSSGWSKSVSI